MTNPVALFSGTSDWLAVPDDVVKIKERLANVIFHKAIDGWEHLDFVWGMDSPTACYDGVIAILKRYFNMV